MKKNIIPILAVLTLGLAACNKENGNEPGATEVQTADVKIEPIITKATSTNFENGDQIGLTIVRADGSKHAQNACLTYADKVFSSSLKWYAEGGEACSIMAYYPYSEAGVPTSFTVASDQSAGAGTSDLMTATKSEVYPQSSAVMAVFHHQLTQIIINIDNKAGAKVNDVTIKGVIPTVNLLTSGDGAITVAADQGADAVNIKTQVVEEGVKYRAIIAPQTRPFEVSVNVAGAVLVSAIDETELKSGYTYSVAVEILADMVNANISGDIENWENGGNLNGNIKDESEAEELDGSINYRGKNYRTGVFGGRTWMTEPLAYLPEGITASENPAEGKVWYPYSSDGTDITVLKDEASIKANGYLYNYEAVFGTTITEDNLYSFENAQGICPKGWHVPSRAEYFALFGYSNKNDAAGESGPQTNKEALFWDAESDYATVVKANQLGFNIVQSGLVNNKHNALICSDKNCTAEELYGKPAMTYFMTSTGYKKTTSSLQFFAGMTTFTTAAYPLGRLSLAYSNYTYGLQVRCVKNN